MDIFREDTSTVFSIIPFPISEFKPGLYPGQFKIAPCYDVKLPVRLIVTPSIHYRYVPDNPKPDAVETASYRIADAIVKDYLDGSLWVAPDAHPGITWAHGTLTTEEFIKRDDYRIIKDKQHKWFLRVFEETSNDWNKIHSYKVVSDPARYAAKYLGKNPEWLTLPPVEQAEPLKCPACSTLNDSSNAVCTNCRCVLNEEKYKKLSFASAR